MTKSNIAEIVKRYSNALHSLALEEKKKEIITNDLKKIYELGKKNKEFNKILFSSLISPTKHYEILRMISDNLKLNTITKNFLFLLSLNKRLMLFNKIYKYYLEMLSKEKNVADINIILPQKMDKNAINKIEKKLKFYLKEKTKLNFVEDKNIISGFIIKSGSMMLDYSTKSELDKIKSLLN